MYFNADMTAYAVFDQCTWEHSISGSNPTLLAQALYKNKEHIKLRVRDTQFVCIDHPYDATVIMRFATEVVAGRPSLIRLAEEGGS